jgi:predicted short-subunit dehydrogenase-like oxidoreductase (DUF2520 family)
MDFTQQADPTGVFIYGCGAVGSALGLALGRAGVVLRGASCRTSASAARAGELLAIDVSSGDIPASLTEADTVIVAVPDPAIRHAAEQLAASGRVTSHQVVLHCSGSRPASELSPLADRVAGVGSFHPLISFAHPESASRLLGQAAFAIEGAPAALVTARRLAAALGGFCLEIGAEDRVLYHAAAATASNHLVALAAQATACLVRLGVGQGDAIRALVPLMRSTLNNLDRVGLPEALTGPVARGDAATVRAHLAALGERAPDELYPYVVMARRALAVARDLGTSSPDSLDRVASEFEREVVEPQETT